MTNEIAIKSAVEAHPKVTLKITRADLINQVVMSARDDYKKGRGKLQEAEHGAVQKYVDAVNAYALKKHSGLIEQLQKATLTSGAILPRFTFTTWNVRMTGGKAKVESIPNIVRLEFRDDRHTTEFRVELTLTKPLQALRKKLFEAIRARLEYDATSEKRITQQRAEVRDRLVRQSIKNSPDGAAMLAAIEALRVQLETETDQNILEGS